MTKLHVILISSLMLLGALSYFARWEEKTTLDDRQKEKKEARLFRFIPNQVVRLELKKKNLLSPDDKHEIVMIKNSSGEWFIETKGEKLHADAFRVENVLNTLASYSSVMRVSTQATSWAEYGVKDPRFEVKIFTVNGEETLSVGDNTIVEYGVYLRVGAKPEVFVGSQHIALALNLSFFDLKRKETSQK